MINNTPLANGLRFLLLVLVQVLIFNRLNFFGYINPMVISYSYIGIPSRKNGPPSLHWAFYWGSP